MIIYLMLFSILWKNEKQIFNIIFNEERERERERERESHEK